MTVIIDGEVKELVIEYDSVTQRARWVITDGERTGTGYRFGDAMDDYVTWKGDRDSELAGHAREDDPNHRSENYDRF